VCSRGGKRLNNRCDLARPSGRPRGRVARRGACNSEKRWRDPMDALGACDQVSASVEGEPRLTSYWRARDPLSRRERLGQTVREGTLLERGDWAHRCSLMLCHALGRKTKIPRTITITSSIMMSLLGEFSLQRFASRGSEKGPALFGSIGVLPGISL